MRWFILLVLVALGADAPKEATYLLDRSKDFAYVLPNAWTVQHREGLQHDLLLLPASDDFKRNVTIEERPGTETLEALKQAYEQEIPQVLSDFQLISSSVIELEGKGRAMRIVASGSINGLRLRQASYIITLGVKHYFIMCSTPLSEEAKHDGQFEAFVASISKPSNLDGIASSEKVAPIVSTDAAFFEPSGWIRLKPDKPKTKGWFISPKSDPRSPESMIMIDVGKPSVEDLRDMAQGMALQWGGRVLEEKTSLDGVEALRIRVDKPARGLRPVEGVVALRNGHVYMLMGGASSGKKVVDQVEEVRKRWKWID